MRIHAMMPLGFYALLWWNVSWAFHSPTHSYWSYEMSQFEITTTSTTTSTSTTTTSMENREGSTSLQLLFNLSSNSTILHLYNMDEVKIFQGAQWLLKNNIQNVYNFISTDPRNHHIVIGYSPHSKPRIRKAQYSHYEGIDIIPQQVVANQTWSPIQQANHIKLRFVTTKKKIMTRICPNAKLTIESEWDAGIRMSFQLEKHVSYKHWNLMIKARNLGEIVSGWKLQMNKANGVDDLEGWRTFEIHENVQENTNAFDFNAAKQFHGLSVDIVALKVVLSAEDESTWSCEYAYADSTTNFLTSIDLYAMDATDTLYAYMNDEESEQNRRVSRLSSRNLLEIIDECDPNFDQPCGVGWYHACGLNPQEQAVCWNGNQYGQSTPPENVKFIQLAAYDHHTCGITENRIAMCWGSAYRALVNWQYVSQSPPSTPMISIAAGGLHACGITTNSEIECWGDQTYHQSTSQPGIFLQISAGYRHSCAIVKSSRRQLVCWGYCELNECTPGYVDQFQQVSAGNKYSCAITSDNDVRCWGLDFYNRTLAPTTGKYKRVEASKGGYHTCAIQMDNRVVCWGIMTYAPPGEFAAIAVGAAHTCGVSLTGEMQCWGSDEPLAPAGFPTLLGANCVSFEIPDTDNSDSKSGMDSGSGSGSMWDDFGSDSGSSSSSFDSSRSNDTEGSQSFDSSSSGSNSADSSSDGSDGNDGSDSSDNNELDDDDENIYLHFSWYRHRRDIKSGIDYSCGTTETGSVKCWGNFLFGMLYLVVPPPTVQLSISLEQNFVCSLQTNGVPSCWGLSEDQAGMIFGGLVAPPTTELFVYVSTRGMHACGLKSNARVKCWGYDQAKQLDVPKERFIDVSTGRFHTCGITTKLDMKCWGGNAFGQTDAPPDVKFHRVSCGLDYTCGITYDRNILCWGFNNNNQAIPPIGGAYKALSAGLDSTCAIRIDGTLQCWGASIVSNSIPAGKFSVVGVGTRHACAVGSDGVSVCWGDNTYSQLRPSSALTSVFPSNSNLSLPRQNCAALGWPASSSIPRICSQSLLNGTCSGPVTAQAAQLTCSNLGGRLPSIQEILHNVIQGSTCDYDDQMVWSSTRCNRNGVINGYLAAPGSTLSTQSLKCLDAASTLAYASCVSTAVLGVCSRGTSGCQQTCVESSEDTTSCTCDDDYYLGKDGVTCFGETTPVKTTLSCSTLGWSTPTNTSLELCTTSNSASNAQCSNLMQHQDAFDFCAKKGARLPTRQEILSGFLRNTPCSSCATQTWSSTACSMNGILGMLTVNASFSSINNTPFESCTTLIDFASVCCVGDI